ncbi:NifU family protein [Histomonas meleagridis]|uniref:NifU family protein n=1 Tax=Histomonas meleagridis TaxID=135588 RepID=UPI00355A369E|nr:NifU family protein [Histomonas meleagridis]KAH0798319.1 NifU family protein [Histomonas meleagridis]
MLSFVNKSHNLSFLRFFAKSVKDLEDGIKKVIDEQIRPVLKMDGGDIQFDGIDKDGVVSVTLLGHCSGCPSKRVTLHNGILLCLQEEFPEVTNIKETMTE